MCRMTGACQKPLQERISTQTGRVAASPSEQVIGLEKKALKSKLYGDEGGKPWCLVRLGDPLKEPIS